MNLLKRLLLKLLRPFAALVAQAILDAPLNTERTKKN